MSYQLQIITPQGKAYENQIEHAEVPAESGYFGVLSNHAPLLSSSAGGRLTLREKGGKTRVFSVGPGFFETRKNQAVLMTESFSEKN
ncbi:MAG TPA: F0F1 ATP synthase subunit epsilon [Candidatus Omnitrophota bacterium]|nr:hypothetical protein [Candidatus Omnitrophota bacterium]HRK61366.1 F0F1 ATP synthase subunit epsilon [Candidatus Omnitrophota bacterium]